MRASLDDGLTTRLTEQAGDLHADAMQFMLGGYPAPDAFVNVPGAGRPNALTR